MKILNLILITTVAALLVGCEDSAEDRRAKSRANLTTPEVVGQTEDGKTVIRYHLVDPYGHDNFVYRIKGESTLSTSTERPQGKTRVQESQSLLVEDPQPHFIDPQKELEKLKAEIANCDELAHNYKVSSGQFMETSRNYERMAETNRVALTNLLNQFRR